MTEAEALEIARAVGLEVHEAVDDRQDWYREILRRAEADPRIAEALKKVGALSVQASQAEKQ